MLLHTNLQVTTPPAQEPTNLDLTRRHCRIDTLDDADLLAGYLIAARVMAEAYLSRALITQTLLWTLRPESMLHPDQSRLWRPIVLPRAPLQSIVSVTVLDYFGNTTVITPATLPVVPPQPIIGYIADLAVDPARLTIGYMTPLSGGQTLNCTPIESVQIEMIAGYGADPASVPPTIIQAIMMTAAFLYEHRGDVGAEMPQAVQWLLDRDRLQFLG